MVHSRGMAVVVGAMLTAIGRSALAVTTTWTNPNGGTWNNPANWSNGVPGPGDLAVLAGLPGDDGYAIDVSGFHQAGVVKVGGGAAEIRLVGNGTLVAVGGCYVGLDGAGTFRITGPMVNVVGPTLVGGPYGGVVLDVAVGSVFSTTTLNVSGSASGENAVTIQDHGSVLYAANGASIGVGGTGQLIVSAGATFAGTSLTCGPLASTSLIIGSDDSAPIQLLGALQRGGTLVVSLDPTYEPVAFEQLPIIATSGPMTSAWSLEDLPQVYDELSTLVPTALGEYLQIPDPYVELVVTPDPIIVTLGFTAEFDVYRRRLSGLLELHCCDGSGDLPVIVNELPGGPGDFDLAPGLPLTLVGTQLGETRAEVFTVAPYQLLSGSAGVQVEPTPNTAIERISVTALGTQASTDTPPLSPQLTFNTFRITPDRRYVLFSTCAPEFLAQPQNGPCQLYLKDRVTGQLEIVTIGPNGQIAADGQVIGADVSDEARFVVFAMAASNFSDSPPPLGVAQIWLRDRVLGTTSLITGNLGLPSFGNAGSYVPRITGDGRYVVFATDATNLAVGAFNGTKRDIVRWDRVTGELTLASVAPGPLYLNLPSNNPACSADGRYVAFSSAAPNVAPAGEPILPRMYVKDMVTETLTLASVATDGTIGNGASDRPSFDASGRFLAFDSLSSNLGPGASSSGRVWLRDLLTGTTDALDVSQLPDGLAGTASAPVVSADGRFIALVARDAVNPDFPLLDTGVFRVDRLTGETLRLAANEAGVQLDDCYAGTGMSADGLVVLFASPTAGIVPFDTNGTIDIFAQTLSVNPGDLDGAIDLALLIGAWGQTGGAADLNGDGVVGAGDLAALLGAWTP
jgi:Tol biopolymer transport system component